MDQKNVTMNGKRNWVASLIRRSFMLAVLVAAIGGGYLYWEKLNHAPQAVQSQQPHRAMPVDVLRVQPKTVPLQPVYLGQTEAFQSVEIRARVSGFLEKKHFVEGSKVEAGQLLFNIDPRSFKAALDLAKAQLASSQAELAKAEQKVGRYSKLVNNKAATLDELDDWRTEKLVALANIQMNKARITQAELDLSYTDIKSPITGLIGMAQKDVGSYVNNSTDDGLLAKVAKIDPIYVRYNLSEQDLLLARSMAAKGLTNMPDINNLRLHLTLADGTEYPEDGKITFQDPEIATGTGTMVMRGTFPNPDSILRPGQFVHVQVRGVNRLHTLMVPKTAVLENPTGAMVYVVNAENKVEVRSVKMGAWRSDQWIVEEGLNPGDAVIVDKLLHLRPGMEVIPQDVKASGENAPAAGSGTSKEQ